MKLKVKDLEHAKRRAISDIRCNDRLLERVKSEIGPSILTEKRSIDDVCLDALEYLDVNQRLGRELPRFEPSLIRSMTEHVSPAVRRLAARLGAKNALQSLASDRSASVRGEVAKRIPLTELKAMVRQFPGDTYVNTIYNDRLDEEKSSEPENTLSMYDDMRLGELPDYTEELTMIDLWYDQTAANLIAEFGQTLDVGWQSAAVQGIAWAVRSNAGIEIDQEKLLKLVNDALEARDDDVLAVSPLREMVEGLKYKAALEENVFMSFDNDDAPDDSGTLMSLGLTAGEYIKRMNEVFQVTHEPLSAKLLRFVISEGIEEEVMVPTSAMTPDGKPLNGEDEGALDMYVEHVTARWKMNSVPLTLGWQYSVEGDDVAEFIVGSI